jgi:hypothetical protein
MGWWLATCAEAANITVSQDYGSTVIHVDGFINPGDDEKFAAIKTWPSEV